MQKCLINFHSLKIKNQVIIVQILSFGLVEIILIIIFLINRNQVQDIMIESTTLVQQKLITKSFNIYSNFLKHSINRQYKEKELELIAMGNLYYFVDNKQNANLLNSLLIPSPSQNQSELFDYNQFPYFFYTQQNSINITQIPDDLKTRNIVNFSKLLNLLLFPIRIHNWYDSKTFYTTIQENQFYSMYPITFRNLSYRPHERIWYISHLASIQAANQTKYFTVTDPYISFSTGLTQSSITYSLLNNQQELEGVVSTNYILLQLSTLQSFKFMNIALTNLDGQLIAVDMDLLQRAKTASNPFIYEIQITGFNQEDWIQIKYQYFYSNGTSNCIQSLNKFCRYNRLVESNIYITIYLMQNKFYLLTFSNSEYLKEVNNQTQNIVNDITWEIAISIITFATSVFVFLILSYLIIQLNLKPYKKIKDFLKIQIDPFQRFKEEFHFYKKDSFFQQVNLESFYENIRNKKQTKCQECQSIECFRYPKQSLKENFDLSQLKNHCITKLSDGAQINQITFDSILRFKRHQQ